ncbi:MAG TPA: hypothetical protein VHP31_11215 [Caproicibacter sp.]|nr:hypothetical protein [Caproicibacter sp.]
MLLIIEDKDNPTGQIAAEMESEDAAELAYIPVIAVQLGYDAQQVKIKCAIDRMSFEYRKIQSGEPVTAQQSEKLVPVYLKALCHIGKRPAYLSPSAYKSFVDETAETSVRLYTSG